MNSHLWKKKKRASLAAVGRWQSEKENRREELLEEKACQTVFLTQEKGTQTEAEYVDKSTQITI